MAQGFQVVLPQRLGDADNAPGVGWKVSTWVADGTFTTPLTTYSTATLSATNTNPIITDASGYFRAFVAQDVSLDVSVTDENDVPVSNPSILSLKPMASGFEDGATLTDAVLVSPTLSSVTNSDVKVLAADATASSASTGATLTSLTGFSWTLVAGGTYAFTIRGKVGMTTSGGLAMAFKYTTATIASIAVTATQWTASAVAVAQSTTVTDQTKFINQKAVAYIEVELAGSLVVTLGGSLAVQFAQETSHSDTTTVYKGFVGEFVRTS
jgi:hypothetical protein